MKLKIYQIDAFTNKVFQGNYAAVIILEEWLSTELMQQIATENNLSETAFALKNTQNIYDIRWFSSLTEFVFICEFMIYEFPRILTPFSMLLSPRISTLSSI